MKNIKIEITATAMSCKISCNGIDKEWVRTGNGSAKSTNKGYWDEQPGISEDLADVLDGISVLDLMYECGTYSVKP